MKRKIKIFVALLLLNFIVVLPKVSAQEIPPNLAEAVPSAIEKLNSDDVNQRVSILNELVVPQPQSCTGELVLPFKLAKEDYVYVVRQILEKDLTVLDEKTKPEVWYRLAHLIRTYQMKEFARPLTAYLNEPVSVQGQIITTLQGLEAKEFDANVALLLDSPEKYIQRLSLETLISFRSKKAVPVLSAMLTGGNESEQYWAMLKLVEIDGKEASPQIAERLKDANENMRYWALHALVKLNARQQAPKVWKLVNPEETKNIRGFAIAALITFEQKEAVPLVIKQIKNLAQGINDYAALDFIDKIKPQFIIPTLISLYNSKEKHLENEEQNEQFRYILLRTLTTYKTLLAIPIFRQNLVDKKGYYGSSWRTDTGIARILLELNATEAIDDIISVFNECIQPMQINNHSSEAGELAIILAKFGDKKVWKQLIDYVEKSNFHIRDNVIAELNKQIDPKLWNEAQIKTPPQIPYNSVKYIAELTSRETKIPISFEYEPKRDTIRCQPLDSGDTEGMPCEYIDGKISALNTVIAITSRLNYDEHGKYTFIFDNGKIRILSVEKAIDWWRKNILTK